MNVYLVYPKYTNESNVIYTRPLKIFSDKLKAQEWVKDRIDLEKRIVDEIITVSYLFDSYDCENCCLKPKARLSNDVQDWFIAHHIKDRKRFNQKELKMISICSIYLFGMTPIIQLFSSYSIYTQKVH